MTDTHTYSALANTYGNFMVPSAKIMVEGSEGLSSKNIGITELNVNLSLKYASSLSIEIAGAYDRKSRSFNSQIKSSFSLGKTLEAEIGYLSERTKIFKGFITSVIMDYNDNPTLKITAMDARKLMMQADCKERYFEKPNYSDIVSEVLSPYSGLCTLKQEESSDNLKNPVYQKMCDYSFINDELAGKTNKEFFIVGDNAYFRKAKSEESEIITLEYGLSLLSFRRQSNYISCKITANSYDKKEQTAINSLLTAKSSDTQKEALSEPPNYICVQGDAETEAELKIRAESEARKKIDEASIGIGRCIGMPCLVPGRYIKLDKLDDSSNQKYYIVEVRHILSGGGFFTEFDIEGWL